MNIHSEKVQEDKSQAGTFELSQQEFGDDAKCSLTENHPQATIQNKLQKSINNSSRMSQLHELQQKVDQRPATKRTTGLPIENKATSTSIQGYKGVNTPIQRVLTVNGAPLSAALLGNPPQNFYQSINRALEQQHGIAVHWPTILPHLITIANDGGTYNYASTSSLVARIHNGETAAQIMADYQLQGDVNADIDKGIVIEGSDLSTHMQSRFKEAVTKFNGTILAKSELSKGKNQVVVYGVSTKGSGMKDYGSTTIYIGNNGYDGMDYSKYTELWSLALKAAIPSTTGVRIVIAVNLSINRSVAELYATLLHEWEIHAKHWAGVIAYIRSGKGAIAVAHVKGQGHVRRAKGEHDAYAKMSDAELIQMVLQLGLDSKSSKAVLEKLKKDRDRH